MHFCTFVLYKGDSKGGAAPCLESRVEAHIKEPRLFLGTLDRFLSNGLGFSNPACKGLNKVLAYQSFLNIGHCKN